MQNNQFMPESRRLRPAPVRLIQIATLALLAAMAIPATAAENRAVKLRAAPVYPEVAKRMKVTGEVRLEVTVDPEGRVTGVKSLSGNVMLVTAAEDAVRKWRFEPGPATSTVDVILNFALTQ
jgi:TonB family protein